MNSNCFLKFFYQDNLVYQTQAVLSEKIIYNSRDIQCNLSAEACSTSFGYNRVEVYLYSRMIYWFSFKDTKYMVKSNKEKINVSFYRKQNSIDFIMQD